MSVVGLNHHAEISLLTEERTTSLSTMAFWCEKEDLALWPDPSWSECLVPSSYLNLIPPPLLGEWLEHYVTTLWAKEQISCRRRNPGHHLNRDSCRDFVTHVVDVWAKLHTWSRDHQHIVPNLRLREPLSPSSPPPLAIFQLIGTWDMSREQKPLYVEMVFSENVPRGPLMALEEDDTNSNPKWLVKRDLSVNPEWIKSCRSAVQGTHRWLFTELQVGFFTFRVAIKETLVSDLGNEIPSMRDLNFGLETFKKIRFLSLCDHWHFIW